jgi:hypothetical protein
VILVGHVATSRVSPRWWMPGHVIALQPFGENGDRQRAEILPANLTFRAVALSRGKYTVKFMCSLLEHKGGIIVLVLTLCLLSYSSLRRSKCGKNAIWPPLPT